MVVGGGAISDERGTPVVDRVDPEPSSINDGASERERERARERERESEKERERARESCQAGTSFFFFLTIEPCVE